MFHKGQLLYRVLILLLVFALIVPLIAACDDDDDNDQTTSQATAATTQPSAATTQPLATTTEAPVSNEPVKIGVIASWTGTQAMLGVATVNPAVKVMDYLLEQGGGILGGRNVEFIKCDDQSLVSSALSCYTKLATQENVSAVVLGGVGPAQISTSAEQAKIREVPLFALNIEGDVTDNLYANNVAFPPRRDVIVMTVEYAVNEAKIHTASLIYNEATEYRERSDTLKEMLEGAGVDVLSEQVLPVATTDLAPYATKIKRDAPDAVFLQSNVPAHFTGFCKSMLELGGWGSTKLITHDMSPVVTISQPEMEEIVFWTAWFPGVESDASKAYHEAYLATGGNPTMEVPVESNFMCFQATIAAIEEANSDDPKDIAKVARSGQFAFETPGGVVKISADGRVTNPGSLVLVEEGGQLVQVYPK